MAKKLKNIGMHKIEEIWVNDLILKMNKMNDDDRKKFILDMLKCEERREKREREKKNEHISL